MDRTHFLASQAFTAEPKPNGTSRSEIDAFYAAHGHEYYVHAFRVRRSIGRLFARLRNAAEQKRDLASTPTSR